MIYFPEDILESNHPLDTLQKCLSAFVFEGTVSKTGQPLYPVSITAIIAAIYRHMQEHQGLTCPNICDKKNHHFLKLHTALDRYYRDLRQRGVGTHKKKSEASTKKEENTLWERSVLGSDNPESLLNAVFFLNGKNFALQ